MKIRILRVLILFCLGLPGSSIGAAEAAQTDELKISKAGAADAEETEGREGVETDAVEGVETDAVEGVETDAVEGVETDAVEGVETDAVEGVETDAVEGVETDAVEGVEIDAVEGVETDAVEGVETDAVEAEESGGSGIFSSILKWFQGRNADTASEGKQAQGRQRPREDARTEVTLSHVYQATQDLIAEIEILRQAMGVADNPGEADLREDQAPIHAYSKSLELMEKTARVQRRLGMIPVEAGQIPVKNITPQDVYRNVQAVIEELRRVKRQLVIKDEIQPAPFAGAKTPSLIYKSLGDASFLLNGLVGRPTTSNDAYMHVLQVHDEMELIAAKLGVALEIDLPIVEGTKEPKEAAQQILRATYKVINLQSRLGMDASGIPNLTLVKVTPAEVFDATNILLAELARIKVHLNIQLPRGERRESRNKRSKDVFAQVLLVIKNLNTLTKAADNTD